MLGPWHKDPARLKYFSEGLCHRLGWEEITLRFQPPVWGMMWVSLLSRVVMMAPLLVVLIWNGRQKREIQFQTSPCLEPDVLWNIKLSRAQVLPNGQVNNLVAMACCYPRQEPFSEQAINPTPLLPILSPSASAWAQGKMREDAMVWKPCTITRLCLSLPCRCLERRSMEVLHTQIGDNAQPLISPKDLLPTHACSLSNICPQLYRLCFKRQHFLVETLFSKPSLVVFPRVQ